MNSYRTEREEDVTRFNNPESILRDGCHIIYASSAATPVGNPSIMLQSLEAALEDMTTPIPRAEREDTFDGLFDSPISEERAALKNRTPQPAYVSRLESTMRKLIASIPGLVEDTVILWRCRPNHGIKPGNENHFHDPDCGRQRPDQRFCEYHLLFSSRRDNT